MQKTRILHGATMLVAAATLPLSPVQAHEDDELEEIIVVGRWDRPIGLTVSASQGFVGQEDLDTRPRLRPGDLLEAIPGLVITQHSGSGKSNQMFLRGFNLDHGTDFASWIDGMPINVVSHGHGQGYTDLNFMIPELVESLEFRKGPYYADVGDFSSAGSAHFSTPKSLASGFLKAGAGEYGFRSLLYADSFDTGQGDLLVGLQTGQYDGPWAGIDEDLGSNKAVVRFSRSVPDEHEWNVTFMGYDADWNSADQVPLRAVRSGRVSRLGTIDQTLGGETSRYSLSGRWHRDIGDQRLTARAYAVDYQLDLYSNFTYFLDDPDDGDQIEQVDDRQIYGGDLTWAKERSDNTTYRTGVSFRYDDVPAVGLYRSTQQVRTATVREDSLEQFNVGMFADVSHAWNERWRTILGVRADYHDFDVKRSNLAENTGTDDDFIVSPKLNIIYALTDNTEGYFSAGTAFHSNDARGTVIATDPASGDAADPVDPLVRSKGAEIGFRTFRDARLNLSASAWVLELDSELLFVGDAGNTEATTGSRRYGIEVPVYYRVSDNWMFDAELSLTRSAFTDTPGSEDSIPGSVDTVFSSGAMFNFDNGFYGALRLRHFGARPLTEDGSVESDPSTVWNMSLGYTRGKFDIRLDALNLFDSRDDDITYFYESRLPGEPVDGFSDVHYHPIEPRSLRLYVTWLTGSR